MSNMSYCRFENTSADLQDCCENIFNELSSSENEARDRLVDTCIEIIEALGGVVEQQCVITETLEEIGEISYK